MNNKFELGDLVRYTQGSTNLYNSWWGYVAENKARRDDNVYIYWFSADQPHFEPFFSMELKGELLVVSKGKQNEC